MIFFLWHLLLSCNSYTTDIHTHIRVISPHSSSAKLRLNFIQLLGILRIFAYFYTIFNFTFIYRFLEHIYLYVINQFFFFSPSVMQSMIITSSIYIYSLHIAFSLIYTNILTIYTISISKTFLLSSSTNFFYIILIEYHFMIFL